MKEIFTRTTTRRFERRPVENETITQLLRAAMQAPSAGDQEAWEFYVVRKKETLRALAHASPYAGPAALAPMAIVVAIDRKKLRFPACCDIDGAIAAENILLEAESLGLGAVFLGIAPLPERMEVVSKALSLPEDFVPVTVIAIGYPLGKRPSHDRYDPDKVHYID